MTKKTIARIAGVIALIALVGLMLVRQEPKTIEVNEVDQKMNEFQEQIEKAKEIQLDINRLEWINSENQIEIDRLKGEMLQIQSGTDDIIMYMNSYIMGEPVVLDNSNTGSDLFY